LYYNYNSIKLLQGSSDEELGYIEGVIIKRSKI
jgi:hypothetical protein